MSALPADDIMRLPIAERLKLAEEIWEGIRAHPDGLPVTEAQRAELDRRLQAHEADPGATEHSATVLERIRKQK